MVDMDKVTKSKTDQLNFDDLSGRPPMTVKVTDVKETGAKDQPISVSFENDGGKPYKPCLSMRRVLREVWGKDGKLYIGKSLTLFGDPDVVFGGVKVGGIRISHMSDLKEEKTILLTATKANKKPYKVKPLAITVEADPAIIESGNQAASSGVAAYTAWLATLSADVKPSIKPYHSNWSAQAKQADNAGEVI